MNQLPTCWADPKDGVFDAGFGRVLGGGLSESYSWRAALVSLAGAACWKPEDERKVWLSAGGHAFARAAAEALLDRAREILGPEPVTPIEGRALIPCPLHGDMKGGCDCPTMADWLGEDLPDYAGRGPGSFDYASQPAVETPSPSADRKGRGGSGWGGPSTSPAGGATKRRRKAKP